MKTTVRCHILSTRMTIINYIGEDVEESEPSHTAGGKVKWCIHLRKQFGGSSVIP